MSLGGHFQSRPLFRLQHTNICVWQAVKKPDTSKEIFTGVLSGILQNVAQVLSVAEPVSTFSSLHYKMLFWHETKPTVKVLDWSRMWQCCNSNTFLLDLACWILFVFLKTSLDKRHPPPTYPTECQCRRGQPCSTPTPSCWVLQYFTWVHNIGQATARRIKSLN